MASEDKQSNTLMIIIGVGALIGVAAIIYSYKKHQEAQTQMQAAYAQAYSQQMQCINDLNNTVKRLEDKVQILQPLRPLPALQAAPPEPLKPPEPKIVTPLSIIKPEPEKVETEKATDKVTYKNNEGWEAKYGPRQTIHVGDKTITIPGELLGLQVMRNARTAT